MSFAVSSVNLLGTGTSPWALAVLILAAVFGLACIAMPLRSIDDLDAEKLPHSLNDVL